MCTDLTVTKGFGESPFYEFEQVYTQVGMVADSADYKVFLTAFQNINVLSREKTTNLQRLKITNNSTGKSLIVPVCTVWGKQSTQNPKTIVITRPLQNILKLNIDDWVTISNDRDWDKKYLKQIFSYLSNVNAKTFSILGVTSDKVSQRFEIHCSTQQLKKLGMRLHTLRPPCGEALWREFHKETSGASIGVAKLFLNNGFIYVDLHHLKAADTSSKLIISETLAKMIGVYANLVLSIDFGIDHLKYTLIEEDYISLIKNESIECLRYRFSLLQDIDRIEAASCLQWLSQDIEILLLQPNLLLKMLQIFPDFVIHSVEYSFFVQQIEKHIDIVKENWDMYLEVLEEELFNASEEGLASITRHIGRLELMHYPNSFGETPAHIICKIGYIDKKHVRDLLDELKIDINIRSKIDWTPLHYACQNLDNGLLIALCLLWSENDFKIDFDFTVKNSDGKTPLHLFAENILLLFSVIAVQKDEEDEISILLTALRYIIYKLRERASNFDEALKIQDACKKTPLDYLPKSRDYIIKYVDKTEMNGSPASQLEISDEEDIIVLSNLIDGFHIQKDEVNFEINGIEKLVLDMFTKDMS